jgi:hypothetical protein
MRRSPDHVHVPCADTSGTHPPVPAGPRRLFGHRPRAGAAPPKATTDVQRSSCSSIPGSQTERVKDRRASGTSITIAPSPRVPVAVCRFPAFETGFVDPTAGACRRGPAELELLPGNGDVPLILTMACGYLGTGNAADRPSTAGPADNRPNRDPHPNGRWRSHSSPQPAIATGGSVVVSCPVLGMVGSQTVGLDEFIARWIGRLRRRPYTGPPGPPDQLRPGAGA